jgi:hypothetical protein
VISPIFARAAFAEMTHGAPLPLNPDALLRTKSSHLRGHGHIVIGDIALRVYKHKGRWLYDEREVRQAAQVLANVGVDRSDLVEVDLPAYRSHEEHLAEDEETRDRANWRGQISSWMREEAFLKQPLEQRLRFERSDWEEIGENGLPGGLTWDEFVSTRTASRRTCTIAGTRPLELLTRSADRWWLPRTYAEVLDRWEEVEDELLEQARLCSRCGRGGRSGAAGGRRLLSSTSRCAHRVPEPSSPPTPDTFGACRTGRCGPGNFAPTTTYAGCA